jgi:hypothetical protein
LAVRHFGGGVLGGHDENGRRSRRGRSQLLKSMSTELFRRKSDRVNMIIEKQDSTNLSRNKWW